MKLILAQEVPGLGSAGDVVDVKPGYARNYLVPRGYGIAWTRGGQKQIDALQAARAARSVRDTGQAQDLKSRLEAATWQLTVRAGQGGRLFGAVTAADVVAAVERGGGPAVDKRRVEVRTPIKTVGVHQVVVRVHDDVTATVSVDVQPA